MKRQGRGFQVIQTLRLMNLVDPFGDFQFDEDDGFNEKIGRVFPDRDPIIPQDHAMLL